MVSTYARLPLALPLLGFLMAYSASARVFERVSHFSHLVTADIVKELKVVFVRIVRLLIMRFSACFKLLG